MKKYILRFFLIVSLLAFFVLLLLGAALALIQTEAGQRYLEKTLNRVLVWEDGRMEISGLSGRIPFDFRVETISIHDSEDMWLELRETRLHWSLRELFQREIYIHELGARELNLERLPHTQPRENEMDLPGEISLEWPLPPLNVENLYLDRAWIGHDVLGEEALFTLHGSLLLHQEGISKASLDMQRLDKTETSLSLALELDHSTEHLDADLRFFDSATLYAWIPENSLPRTLELTLQGRGPVKNWPGRLKLQGEEIIQAETDMGLQILDRKVELLLHGVVSISPDLAPDPLDHYLKDPVQLDARLGLDVDRSIVTLHSMKLFTPETVFEGHAEIDLEDMYMQGFAGLELQNIAPLIQPAGLVCHDPARLDIRFQGLLNSPEADIDLYLGRLSGHDLAVDEAEIKARLEYPGPEEEITALVRGSMSARGLDYSLYPQIPGEVSLDFDVHYAQPKILEINALNLKARDLEAALSGSMDMETMFFESDLKARVLDLEDFIPEPARKHGPAGELSLQAMAEGDIREKRYSLHAVMEGKNWTLSDPVLKVLAGPDPGLSASLSLEQDMSLHLESLELKTRELELSAAGLVHLEQKTLDLNANAVVPGLESLGRALEQDLKGSLTTRAAARGTWEDLALSLHADLSGFQPGPDLPEMNMLADVESVFTPELFSGNLKAQLAAGKDSLDLSTDFALKDKRLALAYLQASGFETDLQGHLDLDLETLLMQGEAKLAVDDVNSLAQLAGLEAYGQMQGRISLETLDQKQDMSLELEGLDLILDSLAVAALDLEGRIRDLYADQYIQGQADIFGMEAGEAYFSSWHTNVQGSFQALEMATALSGRTWQPLQLDARAAYSRPDDELHEIMLAKLQGSFAHEDFSLKKPARLSIRGAEASLSPVEIAFGPGELSARGNISREHIQFQIKMQELLLAQIPIPALEHLDGRLSAEADLEGPLSSPRARAKASLRELRPALPDLQDMPGHELEARAALENSELALNLFVLQEQARLLELDLVTPAHFAMDPVAFELEHPAPLQGSLKSALDLATITPFFLPPDQNLAGRLNTELDIAGSIQKPELNGRVVLEDGVFEHITAGVYLSRINALIRASEEQILLEELKATDGEAGTIQGSGRVELDLENQVPWSLDLDIKDANLLRHSLAAVNISSGSLSLAGDTGGAAVEGNLLFGRIEARLPKQSPPGVVHLDVTEKNKPETDLPPPPRQPDFSVYPVDLDLELDFPARVYVRGRGLDSEWGGGLNIKGPAHEPRIRGELNVVRGRLNFLDRRFDLDRDSYIYLDGTFPPEPLLELTAHYRHKRKNISIRVFGPAVHPELELKSDPPMHEDEILAWILFGRDISTLTPFQAITLLNAARTLAADDPGPDILGQMRSLIGVDDIDITQDPEEGHTQFGLGKYVHEQVYIQLRKGTAPGTDQMTVEVELTPRLSLEGSLESDAEGGVLLFWKRDY